MQIDIEVEIGIDLKVGIETGVDIYVIRYRGENKFTSDHNSSNRQACLRHASELGSSPSAIPRKKANPENNVRAPPNYFRSRGAQGSQANMQLTVRAHPPPTMGPQQQPLPSAAAEQNGNAES